MKKCCFLSALISLSTLLPAAEFTLCTYNCGGLADHYDYLRAAVMQKIMQERYNQESATMALLGKIEALALQKLFSEEAQQEWDAEGYQAIADHLTAAPTEQGSPNAPWKERLDGMISNYKVRPVVIADEEVKEMLSDHLDGLTVQERRALMAQRIFARHLKYDILCLQEADYLDASLFPTHYEVKLAETTHSKNGIAWNKERFELVETLGNIQGRAFALKLREKESGKLVLVASGHITGCNPYREIIDPISGVADAAQGNSELQTVVDLFDKKGADIMLIGMDSNVTALHPRLTILKNACYYLDRENHLEPTCASPNQVLNTRIDWIALKAHKTASITNIPVLCVGLNNIQTNISDHKPIAAKIQY